MSEIKYPCVMEHKHNKGLLVWFNKPDNGVIVQVLKNGNDKIGDICDYWIISNFKPYVRPKEYEYQVLFKLSSGCHLLSPNFHKSLSDWDKNYKALGGELFEQSKREVK